MLKRKAMTTLTDEQARELAQEYLNAVPSGDETLGNIQDGCTMARYILSRPSSGVQPIAEDLGNAGQSEGSAQAAPTAPRRVRDFPDFDEKPSYGDVGSALIAAFPIAPATAPAPVTVHPGVIAIAEYWKGRAQAAVTSDNFRTCKIPADNLEVLCDAIISRKSPSPPTAALPKEIAPAIEALTTHQEQLDQDGVMVGVSRQALEEVLQFIRTVAGATASEDQWKPIESAPGDEYLVANIAHGRIFWAKLASRGRGALVQSWFQLPNGRSINPTHYFTGTLPAPPAQEKP